MLAAPAWGCGAARTAGPAGFGSGVAWVTTGTDSLSLRVEIASTDAQHRAGLMGRDTLPDDQGMYFVFPEEQPADAGFWMHGTRVPLSVAYLDAAGVILGIRDMEPCASPVSALCRRYPAGVPFHAALEVSRGWFRRRGVGVGDRVRVTPDPLPAPR